MGSVFVQRWRPSDASDPGASGGGWLAGLYCVCLVWPLAGVGVASPGAGRPVCMLVGARLAPGGFGARGRLTRGWHQFGRRLDGPGHGGEAKLGDNE